MGLKLRLKVGGTGVQVGCRGLRLGIFLGIRILELYKEYFPLVMNEIYNPPSGGYSQHCTTTLRVNQSRVDSTGRCNLGPRTSKPFIVISGLGFRV